GLTITGGPSVTVAGVDAGGLAITNVGPGVNGTDAVNLDQLNTLGSSAATALGGTSVYDGATQTLTAGLDVDGTTYTNVQDALTAVNGSATAGWNLSAEGANVTNVGPGDAVDLNNADGNIVVSKTAAANDVTFDLASDLTIGNSVTVGASLLDTSGLTITGGPSVTVAGVDAGGLAITNVGPGVNGTDAVNLDQLNTLGSSAATALGGTSVYDGATQTLTAGLDVDGTTYTNVQDALTAV
ncbi:adhesin, partial [Chelativorans intermedius]|nr:adhesin [Chelativorans intermedius]